MTNYEREPHYLSGKWLRTRTDEQLHDLADGSFQGGKAFDGARAELFLFFGVGGRVALGAIGESPSQNASAQIEYPRSYPSKPET